MNEHKRQKPETIKCGGSVVKIYTRQKHVGEKSYQIWEVTDYSTGKRRLRMFYDRTKALDCARNIARLMASGEAAAAAMRSSDAASYGRAIQLIRPTGVALENVCAAFASAYAALGGDKLAVAVDFYLRHGAQNIQHRTVADVCDEVLDVKSRRGKSGAPVSKAYHDHLRGRLGRIKTAFATNIHAITTRDLQLWLDGLNKAPLTMSTMQRTLSLLFGFAESRGYLPKGSNPADGLDAIGGGTVGKIGLIAPEQMQALLDDAPDRLKVFIAVGAFAGLRSSEIERLDWGEIDLDRGFVVVAREKSKTRARRLVPIQPNLREWLTRYKGTGAVMTGVERQRTARNWTGDWPRNGLRHSFVSYRLAQIQDVGKVALEAGNSPQMIFSHYRELATPADAERWFSIVPKA